MNINRIILTLSIVFSTQANANTAPAPISIYWDLSETLLSVNNNKAIAYFAFSKMPLYMASYMVANSCGLAGFREHMKYFFLDTLALVPSPFDAPDYEIIGALDRPLPPLQRDFLLGKLNGKQALALIDAWIENNKHIFKNDLQASIFQLNCRMYFFDFEEMLVYTDLLDQFKRCYEAKDAQGNRKYLNIIFANWAQSRVKSLHQKFPELFAYSDLQILSGIEGIAIPQPALFDLVTAKFPNLQTGYYIDDSECHLEVAKSHNLIPVPASQARELLAANGIA